MSSQNVLIASSESAYNYSVVAKPAITRVEQLKGKRLGVSGFGSASHNAALILLKKFNLDAGKDVTQRTQERIEALLRDLAKNNNRLELGRTAELMELKADQRLTPKLLACWCAKSLVGIFSRSVDWHNGPTQCLFH